MSYTHPQLVHGYSLLRTQLNQGYFHDLFNESVGFGVNIEGHRMDMTLLNLLR
jgi:hypothetical protein